MIVLRVWGAVVEFFWRFETYCFQALNFGLARFRFLRGTTQAVGIWARMCVYVRI